MKIIKDFKIKRRPLPFLNIAKMDVLNLKLSHKPQWPRMRLPRIFFEHVSWHCPAASSPPELASQDWPIFFSARRLTGPIAILKFRTS